MAKDNEDIIGVALVHYACPICGREIDDDNAILINQKLTKKAAEEVNELDGKCVGFSNKACDECTSRKDDCIYVIEIDEEKSKPNNLCRTGKYWGVIKDFPLFVDHPEFILETDNGVKYCYMDNKVTKKIGFYDKDKHGI